MTYRKLERMTLWILTILMLFMFCVAEWSNNSSDEINLSLLDNMTTNEKHYEKILKEYRQQLSDLKVENAELKNKIEELEDK